MSHRNAYKTRSNKQTVKWKTTCLHVKVWTESSHTAENQTGSHLSCLDIKFGKALISPRPGPVNLIFIHMLHDQSFDPSLM